MAPTEPKEIVAKELIYALVFGILVVILASGVAYLIFKLKRRKLFLLFVKVGYLKDQTDLCIFFVVRSSIILKFCSRVCFVAFCLLVCLFFNVS